MFPDFNLIGTDINTDNDQITDTSPTLGRVFIIDFDDANNAAQVRIVDGKPVEAVTLKDKVSMYTQMLLKTALGKYRVYDDTDFGVSYFNYLGLRNMPKSTVHAEIEREIIEKIEELDVVDSVQNLKIDVDNTTLAISFDISLSDGTTKNITGKVVI